MSPSCRSFGDLLSEVVYGARSRRIAEIMRTARAGRRSPSQRRSVHAVRENDPIGAHRRIRSGEIKRDSVAVSRLDDDDIREFFSPNCFPGRSADFSQHIAEQRPLEDMGRPMLIGADFHPRERRKFGEGQGRLLAIEARQRHR